VDPLKGVGSVHLNQREWESAAGLGKAPAFLYSFHIFDRPGRHSGPSVGQHSRSTPLSSYRVACNPFLHGPCSPAFRPSTVMSVSLDA
jgi:hypothetical protein